MATPFDGDVRFDQWVDTSRASSSTDTNSVPVIKGPSLTVSSVLPASPKPAKTPSAEVSGDDPSKPKAKDYFKQLLDAAFEAKYNIKDNFEFEAKNKKNLNTSSWKAASGKNTSKAVTFMKDYKEEEINAGKENKSFTTKFSGDKAFTMHSHPKSENSQKDIGKIAAKIKKDENKIITVNAKDDAEATEFLINLAKGGFDPRVYGDNFKVRIGSNAEVTYNEFKSQANLESSIAEQLSERTAKVAKRNTSATKPK